MKYGNNNINIYRIFLNGKFINGTDNYDYAFNRALGIAILKGLDFVNPKSKNLTDMWIGNGEKIYITKNSKK